MDSITHTAPSQAGSPTGRLSQWISDVRLQDVPFNVRERAKHLLLDGIGCLLVGAHLPGSAIAVRTMVELEGSNGRSTVYGWDGAKVSPLQAALLNSTFIQGFELDDYHSEAPLHSNSLVIPAILAAAECHGNDCGGSEIRRTITGADMLLAAIVGYEVGPRVGLALHGTHMLTMGWHSGAIFGPSTAAAASAKVLRLHPNEVEDALGIACTQTGGLMSAQFDGHVKRMQHGFATRNGLLGSLLARNGYSGIKRVYEHKYGGFLSCFSAGNGMKPPYKTQELGEGLGSTWQLEKIRIKAYAAMAGTHTTVDCMQQLQEDYPTELQDLSKIHSITIELGEALFHHGGWQAVRPLDATGAQMNNAYVGATQLVDGAVLPTQFTDEALERDEIWDLMAKTRCVFNDQLGTKFATRVEVELSSDKESLGGDQEAARARVLIAELPGPRGILPEFSNQDIIDKWRGLAMSVIDDRRREAIEEVVLNLEGCQDINRLIDLLTGETRNPLGDARTE